MSSIFKFKQFTVDQSGSTMKINTDGVLLGAIAAQDKPDHILDIGTGTGVIALMLAQRYPAALINAIEIDQDAAQCAELNFERSPYASRLSALHANILDFETDRRYDLVVSNPPYHINSLHNPDQRKKLARHIDEAFLPELVRKASILLAPAGSFWLVLPLPVASELKIHAERNFLSLIGEISIADRPYKEAVRQILGFSNMEKGVIRKEMYIRNDDGNYSEKYKELLADFFTIF